MEDKQVRLGMGKSGDVNKEDRTDGNPTLVLIIPNSSGDFSNVPVSTTCSPLPGIKVRIRPILVLF